MYTALVGTRSYNGVKFPVDWVMKGVCWKSMKRQKEVKAIIKLHDEREEGISGVIGI